MTSLGLAERPSTCDVLQVLQVPILSDIFTAVGAAVLTPIWAIVTARQLSASPMERVAA